MSLFDDLLTEEFKLIPGTLGRYAITKTGVIYSYTRKKFKRLRSSKCRGYLKVYLYYQDTDTSTPYRKSAYIHRLLYEAFKEAITETMQIDHIDRNRLNNTLSNLRVVTKLQNGWNQQQSLTKEYIGVLHPKARPNTWLAQGNRQGMKRYIGCFDSPMKAAVAYDLAVIKARGIYAVTNLVHIADRLYGNHI